MMQVKETSKIWDRNFGILRKIENRNRVKYVSSPSADLSAEDRKKYPNLQDAGELEKLKIRNENRNIHKISKYKGHSEIFDGFTGEPQSFAHGEDHKVVPF